MIALLAAVALLANPSVRPWPIGPGPRYTPPPAAQHATGLTGALRCGRQGPSYMLHLELFANRRVIVVPAGIGVTSGCTSPLHTTAPGGVVHVKSGPVFTLGDLFRVWGQRLTATSLLSFRSSQPVRAYVDGRLATGPIGAIPLTPHAEIVIELGRYLVPHPFFLFAGGTQ